MKNSWLRRQRRCVHNQWSACVRVCVLTSTWIYLFVCYSCQSSLRRRRRKKKLRDVWLETIFVFFFQSIENRRMKQNTSKNCLLLIFLRTNQIQFEEENEIYRREFFFLFSYSLFSSLPIDIIDWSMKRRRRKKMWEKRKKKRFLLASYYCEIISERQNEKKRRVMTHIYRQSLLFLLSLSGFFFVCYMCVPKNSILVFFFFYSLISM